MPEAESEGRTVVLVGSFNPAIFQPMWFVKEGLIRNEEAESVTKNGPKLIVTSDFTAFSVEEGFQFQLEVRKDRFVITCRNPAHWQLMLDLVCQTFEILEHTPVSQMGINRDAHYRVNSAERWKEIGDLLAPKNAWHKLLNPTTRRVMIEGTRDGCTAKYIQATVEPSSRFPLPNRVLSISTNEHYEWAASNTVLNSVEILKSNWDDAYMFSKALTESVFLFGATK